MRQVVEHLDMYIADQEHKNIMHPGVHVHMAGGGIQGTGAPHSI